MKQKKLDAKLKVQNKLRAQKDKMKRWNGKLEKKRFELEEERKIYNVPEKQ